MKIDVHITDKVTGETRIDQSHLEPDDTDEEWLMHLKFQWGEGNYACDCNRGLFFAAVKGEDDPDRQCGVERYRVAIFERGTDHKLYEDGLTHT